MRTTGATYRISRANQLRALASPVRQEIVDVLARLPGASVAALAAALGRPADALYYHLRELGRVGLVLPSGRGRGQRRSEALYRTVAPELSAVYDPGSPSNVKNVSRAIASMLRLGTRDFRSALSSRDVAVSGPRRELWASRETGWLDAGRIARLNRLLREIARILQASHARPGKRLFAVTYLLVPLDRRPRRRKEPRHAKRRTPRPSRLAPRRQPLRGRRQRG